jgi:Rps23 Pro-64 3,4-dihydroxylase Tpa1-like proline 4-hydroxylase
MISELKTEELNKKYMEGKPFNNVIIDNFFTEEFANELSLEFPDYNDPNIWAVYKNAIENKKLTPNWDLFPKNTYQAFHYMNTPPFVEKIRKITGIPDLYADYGMHGGGWHMHTNGGKLNLHKDYSIHPKLNMERRCNIIIYMTPDWNEDWGGGLELWSNDDEKNLPKECITKVHNKFNRAVLFDTSQNSWHGLPDEIRCPEEVYRKSLAIYYVSPIRPETQTNDRALFAPNKDQINDPEILELIKKRSSSKTSSGVYRT